MFGFGNLTPLIRIALTVSFVFVVSSGMPLASAQPPHIESQSSSWLSKLNPMNWSMSRKNASPDASAATTSPAKSSAAKTSTFGRSAPQATSVSHRKPTSDTGGLPGKTLWKSVNQKSRSAWKSTTEILNPFDGKPARKKKVVAKKKAGMLDGLFAPKPEPHPIQTVGDFLQQKSPQY